MARRLQTEQKMMGLDDSEYAAFEQQFYAEQEGLDEEDIQYEDDDSLGEEDEEYGAE